jgi:hypothetical protein
MISVQEETFMKRLLLSILLLLAMATGVVAEEFGELEKVFEIEVGQKVRLVLPVADLRLEVSEAPEVRADLLVRCRWHQECDEVLSDIDLVSRSTPRRFVVELEGLSSWESAKVEVEGTLVVPRTSDLELEIGVGDLNIHGVERNLRVDVGVGKVKIWQPPAAVKAISLEVNVGEAAILGGAEGVSDRRSFLVGSEVFWDKGPGDARIEVEVGVGEVSLWLE